MVLAAQITQIKHFQGLSDTQASDLAAITIEKSFLKGEGIFSDGDNCHGFYGIISGQVTVFKLSPDGREQILHLLNDGDVFGEVPVFEGESYPAYAKANQDAKTLFFPKDPFLDLLRKDPAIVFKIAAELSRRLRMFTNMIEALSLHEVPSRLASYLLDLNKQQDNSDNIILEIPKHQLASLLGTIPETLSRILTKMSKKGMICSTGSKTLQILDIESIKNLALGHEKFK